MKALNIKCLVIAALIWASGMTVNAETLRLTTWNFPLSTSAGISLLPNEESLLRDAAKALERLNSDVICLQGVPDWSTCEKLCDLLSTQSYRVLTCSAFPTNAAQPGRARQVAIIARERAILSWSEQVSPTSGFAFAVARLGSRKVGLFSVQPSVDKLSADRLNERVLAQVQSCDQFRTNRPDVFLIVGTAFDRTDTTGKTHTLSRAGFQSAHASAVTPAKNAASPDLLVKQGSFTTVPRALTVAKWADPILSCDVDLETPSSAATLSARKPIVLRGDPVVAIVPSVPGFVTGPTASSNPFEQNLLWIAMVALFCLWGLIRLFARPRPSMALQVTPAVAGSVSLPRFATEERVVVTIANWLKSRFMQRLLAQRQEMIETQNDTARRTLLIEEKLARIQTDLQDRIQSYESRIQRLENELSIATAENRDLIRDQIHLLKKQLSVARDEGPYLRN